MIAASGTKYYVCDSSKIGRIGFVKLADFSEIDYFITEAELDKKLADCLEDNDIIIERITQ